MTTAKLESPSADRNKDPIWRILETKVFPTDNEMSDTMEVLEIAAGTGTHTEHFCKQLLARGTKFHWYPTDPDTNSLASQKVRIQENTAAFEQRVMAPLKLTLDENGIQEDANGLPRKLDVIININMIHISPWEATLGLMKVAGTFLKRGGVLFLYGPYRVDGKCVESNQRFSDSLQARDPSWGVRDLEKVVESAEANGLKLKEKIDMPANNLSVIFIKK